MNEDRSSWPMVTALVLCYNHARFLAEALDSVAAQDYPNLQLIVADDCSADDSAQRIRAWLNAHRPDALFLAHERNHGICRTLNEMLVHAEGEYVSILSTDDVWMPGKLRGQVRQMESLPDDVGVLYSDAYQMDETGQLLPELFIAAHRSFADMPEGRLFDVLWEGNFIPAMTPLIRRRCFETVGGYDESMSYEDYEMWLRISRRFRFAFFPHVSAKYRIVSTSMTRAKLPAMTRDTELMLIRYMHQGWLSGQQRARAQRYQFLHAEEHYRLERPERFRESVRLCRDKLSPKNLLLLVCCWLRIPHRRFDHLLGLLRSRLKREHR